MPADDETRDATGSQPSFAIDPKWRWVATALGVLGLGAGGVATFTTEAEAGPVGMLIVGLIFMFIAMRGELPHRFKIGENEADWGPIENYVADTIAKAPIESKSDEVERAMELAAIAPEAVARGIGKAALRDASLKLVRDVASGIPGAQLQEILTTMGGEVMFSLESADGARVLIDVLGFDQDALTAEPIADMPEHWAVLFFINRSDQLKFDLNTKRPSAGFNYRSGDRFQRESLRDLLLTLMRESREILTHG